MQEVPAWADIAYLVAAGLFVFGIKGLTHPRTAVRGNFLSAVGMLIAVVVTLTIEGIDLGVVIAGIVIGGAVGLIAAVKVRMTGMPQMVALFNGFGGGASVLVAWAELVHRANRDVVELTEEAASAAAMADHQALIASVLAGLIGAVTFWGSLVAYGKLEEFKWLESPIPQGYQRIVNGLLGVVVLAIGILIVTGAMPALTGYVILLIVASILGFTLVVPIGGADMPVVIALLNSYSGLAAAMTGFVINNNVLIIAGSLVGASGVILTAIMCKAMNRSLTNVMFGGIDASAATATADEVYEGKIKATSAEEIAMMLDGVQRVVVVPGYGMAVAQAQHAVRDLYQLLEERGVNVQFAIHPVAGRMPGHMNVLLAEVDIPYDKLLEMERINPEFKQVDVAIVLGANDVVNPDARSSNSPIAGMPILDVDQARTVIVIKRSLSPGFAGIPNPLFAADNTLMYFGDGKKAIVDLVTAIKES